MTAYSLPSFHRRGRVEEIRRHEEMNIWLWVTFDADDEMTRVNVHTVASEALDQDPIDTTLALTEGDLVEVEGVIIDGSYHARAVRLL